MATEEVIQSILSDIRTNTELKYLNLGGLGLTDVDLEKILVCVETNKKIVGINLAKGSRYVPFDESKFDISRACEMGRGSNQLTLKSIKKIATLQRIRYLRLCGNLVGDEGILALSKMPNLEKLWVINCNITEAGAKNFLNYKQLTFLYDECNNYDPSSNSELDQKIIKHLSNNRERISPEYKKKLENEKHEEKVVAIIKADDDMALRKILIKNDVNVRLEYGCQLLILAVDHNALKCAKLLVASGARIEDHEREYTPLFTAAENGQVDMVKLFLTHGCNLKGEFCFNSETVLSIAAFKFCQDLIAGLERIDFSEVIKLELKKAYHAIQGFTKYSSFESFYKKWKQKPPSENIRAKIEHRDKIVNFFSSLFKSSIPAWIAFGESKNLFIEYTKDCFLFYENIKGEISQLINEPHSALLKDRAKTYKMLLYKYQLLQEKAPSNEEDNDGTDIEDQELVFQIKPLKDVVVLPERLSEKELEKQVNRLNEELKTKTEEQIDWSKYPKFYIAQYRGIHYYRKHFTKSQRADHHFTTHLNRISPAPAVYYKCEGTPTQHQWTRESEIKKNKEEVVEVFNQFETSEEVEQYWSGKKKKFQNTSDMLQQRMSNSYAGYQKDITGKNHPSTALLHNKNIQYYPHYATSDLPFHSLKYSYGQKKIEGLTEWRLRPQFQKNGKPLHPYPGKIFVSMFTPLQMYQQKTRHVAGMHNRKKICLKGTVAPERETSIPGGVDPEAPFYEELLVIPSFEKYTESYKDQYGIDLKFFNKCKQEIVSSLTLDNEDDRTELRKKVKNNIIEGVLIPHKEEQLLAIAHIEATRRGGYLIYRHYNGQYGIVPEGMRIPSKGSSFYTKKEKELLRKTSSLRTAQGMVPYKAKGKDLYAASKIPSSEKSSLSVNSSMLAVDTDWFTDDEMNTLFDHYFGNNSAIRIIAGINVAQHNGETLLENLQDVQLQQVLEESYDGLTQNTIIIPINFGNQHWVALYIHFVDQNRTRPVAGYFDPFGNPISEELVTILREIFQELNKEDILSSPIELQSDGYNCGPWVVAILESLVNSNGMRLPSEDFDIQHARNIYRSVLQNAINREANVNNRNKQHVQVEKKLKESPPVRTQKLMTSLYNIIEKKAEKKFKESLLSSEERLYQAITSNNFNLSKRIVKSNSVDLNYISKNGDGDPLLVHAINLGAIRIARELILAGANVNLGNNGSVREKYASKTPLRKAIEIEIIWGIDNLKPSVIRTIKEEDRLAIEGLTEFLLEHGADVNAQAPTGTTPVGQLFYYWDETSQKAKELLRLLVKYGAKEDTVEKHYKEDFRQHIVAIRLAEKDVITTLSAMSTPARKILRENYLSSSDSSTASMKNSSMPIYIDPKTRLEDDYSNARISTGRLEKRKITTSYEKDLLKDENTNGFKIRKYKMINNICLGAKNKANHSKKFRLLGFNFRSIFYREYNPFAFVANVLTKKKIKRKFDKISLKNETVSSSETKASVASPSIQETAPVLRFSSSPSSSSSFSASLSSAYVSQDREIDKGNSKKARL